MSIIRKRNASSTALLSCNARNNQYILVHFPVNDELIEQVQPRHTDDKINTAMLIHQGQYHNFYQYIAHCFFNISNNIQ